MTSSTENGLADRPPEEIPQHPSLTVAATAPGSGVVVFLGDSITAGAHWDLLFPEVQSRNFGVDGESSHNILGRLAPVIRLKPAKLFLLIGTNDLGGSVDEETIVSNVSKILDQLKSALRHCRIYLQTVMPRDADYTARIESLNRRYVRLAQAKSIVLIDLFPLFEDGQGRLRHDLTDDDLHLLAAGYEVWRAAISPYVL